MDPLRTGRPSGLTLLFNAGEQQKSNAPESGPRRESPHPPQALAPLTPFKQPAQLSLPKAYLHTTGEHNLRHIDRDGLIAGGNRRSAGIGDESGNPCDHGVFVVNPGMAHHMHGDALPENVAVFSNQHPIEDVNYRPRGTASFFPSDSNRPAHIPPLRTAGIGTDAHHSAQFPMTPRTAQGALHVIQTRNPGNPEASAMTPETAAEKLFDEFKKNFPMAAYGNAAYTATSRHDDAVISEQPPAATSTVRQNPLPITRSVTAKPVITTKSPQFD
ncbi:hypothetical protein [Burkholderia thailandensis]|uniref:hypothetical protein n=1 Tax=Burkholderia thailandensis TaxID=57975 RepID=UPI0005B71728|nr:hypothetical protein [Burkholderia thailandensis]KIS53450.1 hypothetical protein BTP_3707 [Burkholderia thailandensis Phuket 4W-1]